MRSTEQLAKSILKQLRWKPDMRVVNYDGECVWLKESFNAEGVRDGITDCCFVATPCAWHEKYPEVPHE